MQLQEAHNSMAQVWCSGMSSRYRRAYRHSVVKTLKSCLFPGSCPLSAPRIGLSSWSTSSTESLLNGTLMPLKFSVAACTVPTEYLLGAT